MKKVGLVGWRGMVGSVLMQRMQEENDFALIDPTFFTTSQAGQKAPDFGKDAGVLKDANDLSALSAMDVIISCPFVRLSTSAESHSNTAASGTASSAAASSPFAPVTPASITKNSAVCPAIAPMAMPKFSPMPASTGKISESTKIAFRAKRETTSEPTTGPDAPE